MLYVHYLCIILSVNTLIFLLHKTKKLRLSIKPLLSKNLHLGIPQVAWNFKMLNCKGEFGAHPSNLTSFCIVLTVFNSPYYTKNKKILISQFFSRLGFRHKALRSFFHSKYNTQ